MANIAKWQKTEFHVGDTVEVHQKKLPVFEGVVIAIRGKGENKTFTVRKIAAGGVGVERIWSLISPWITKIVVKKKGKVRRGKLYYLRKGVKKKD